MPHRHQPRLRDIFFMVHGSIIPVIARRLAAIALVCVFAILAAGHQPGIFAQISAIPFTLIGIALSVFMSFRNSTCYARWWDGRQLWGEVFVACRCLARTSAVLESEPRDRLLRSLCAFVAGLSARLRHHHELAAICEWLPGNALSGNALPGNALSGRPNPTDRVLQDAGAALIELNQQGLLKDIPWSVLEGYLSRLSAAQAGCERIASTPVPFAYSLLLHRTALVFCLVLPFALAGSLGWWTLLPVLLVAYTFFGLDALSHQLEDPFCDALNALPLDILRANIQREMQDVMTPDLTPGLTTRG